MSEISVLKFKDGVSIEQNRLGQLAQNPGAALEMRLGTALEDLAVCLSSSERAFREGRRKDVERHLQTLCELAEQIGMPQLAEVSSDVMICLKQNDEVATKATFARLLRIGKGALNQIWDLKGMSI